VKLFLEIDDGDLLFSLLHELGSTFYRPLGNGQLEVLYYSGNRLIHFRGALPADKIKLLEQTAWRVSDIEIDEVNGVVKISQGER